MDLRRRRLTLAAVLVMAAASAALGAVATDRSVWVLSVHAARPRPTATPSPTPTPLPTPSATPQTTPPPTPPPTSPPTPPPTAEPTPAPTPDAAPVPPSAPVAAADAQAPGTLPLTGPPPVGRSAQAAAIATTPQSANAANVADAGGPSDTQSLFFMVTVVLLGIPALLVMTLVATVLTRR